MNLLLLSSDEINDDGVAIVRGRRFEHAISVIGASCGDSLRAGILGGGMGTARVEAIEADTLTVTLEARDAPPDPLPVILCMAVIRPKALRRALFSAITMGIKEIHLFRSWRVDKSYFASPVLERESLREIALLALEQARDTMPPVIHLHHGFKPFVEDVLPGLLDGGNGYVFHPGAADLLPQPVHLPALVCVGPEGGLIPYEVERLTQAGLLPVAAGQRILTAETAVTALLGKFI
jgi:16S rRNA (uracil1498-N3)-methyltransferase